MTAADISELSAFLAQHARPYDPEEDQYRRPPFAQPVKAGKNSPIYNAHSYHTKVPPEGIVPYLEHYTDPEDLVLDPFCGSGMTGVACLMTGRAAVLNDLSPAAVHIAQNYTTPVNTESLKREFEQINIKVKDEFDWLYETICDHCGKSARIQYMVWSDVLECSRCKGEIVLWDVAVDLDRGIVSETFTCPSCSKEHKKLGLKKISVVPVLTCYECQNCAPKRHEHAVTQFEKNRIAEIHALQIPYWFPDNELDITGPQYRRSALSNRKIRSISDFYTKRNLWALSRLRHEIDRIPDERISKAMLFVLTSALVRASITTRYMMKKSGNAPLSGTIYIPSLSTENNILALFGRKFENCYDYFVKITARLNQSQILATNLSATNLPEQLSNAVDYIFTDPPFGSNIYYSEVNFIWEAWIGKITNRDMEAVVHRKQDGGYKRLPEYTSLMASAFKEMERCLKPGHWASVVFHNSDDSVWQSILEAAEIAGFEIAEINAFDKEQLTFKGFRGQKGLERVTNKDIVLNLRKPCPDEDSPIEGSIDLVDSEVLVIQAVADYLSTNPPHEVRTLQEIWNHALFHMLRDGHVQVSMAGLETLLAEHYQTFKIVDGRYYLRGQAVVGGNIFELEKDSGAIAWLGTLLSNGPQTTGELIPRWQQETAHLGTVDIGRLDRLLEQNFWLDEASGHWRSPTPLERDKMNARTDLSRDAHLRLVRRYLAGELDRRPNDRELAAWVRFCYNREYYPEASQIFEQISESHLDPQEYRAIKKMAQVARLKNQ